MIGFMPKYSVGGRMVIIPEEVKVEAMVSFVGGIAISRFVSTGSPKQFETIRSKAENKIFSFNILSFYILKGYYHSLEHAKNS